MRRFAALAAALVLLCAHFAHAAPYYESATMGSPGQTSGDFLGDSQYIGARFLVPSTVTIDRIGGHIRGSGLNAPGETLFGIVCQLSGWTDMPDSLNLSTPDILAVTTFIPPASSADIAIPIGPITLGPGTYGVLFGSGLFGATGDGLIPFNSTNIGTPSYFWKDSVPQWRNGGLPPGRLTVYEQIPEPTSLWLVAGSALMLLRRRHGPCPYRSGTK